MPTRTQVMQAMAEEMLWPHGDIASGSATTAVVTELAGAYEDDEFNSDRLLMPDAANTDDQQRIVSDFTGSTATFTWAGNRTDTTFTNETFILIPGAEFTLVALRNAVNTTLERTKRTQKFVIPTVDDEKVYSAYALSWLRNARDIDAVHFRASPNALDNEDFTRWQSGASSAPDSWTLAGSGATVARDTSFRIHANQPYTVTVTRSTNDATLTQDVPYSLAHQWIEDLVTVQGGAWVTASAASRVRIGVNDGNDTTWSDYHSGDGEPEWLTVDRTLTAAASRVQFVFSVDSGDTTGRLIFPALCESSVPQDLKDTGSTAYREQHVTHVLRNVGSVAPQVEVGRNYGRNGQLVVYTRRPFATLSADSDSTDCPEDVLTFGSLYHLFSAHRKGESRDRPDRLAELYSTPYRQLAGALIDLPVGEPLTQYVVRGV